MVPELIRSKSTVSAIRARNWAAETTGSSLRACIGGERGPPDRKFARADLAHPAGPRGRRDAVYLLNSRQNWRSLIPPSSAKFPPLIPPLTPPTPLAPPPLPPPPPFH